VVVGATGALKQLVAMMDNRTTAVVQAKAANCIKNVASGIANLCYMVSWLDTSC
jgi:hypothetical protein